MKHTTTRGLAAAAAIAALCAWPLAAEAYPSSPIDATYGPPSPFVIVNADGTICNMDGGTGGGGADCKGGGSSGGADTGSSATTSCTPGASSHANGVSVCSLQSIAEARTNGGSGELERLIIQSTGGFTGNYLVRIWDKNPTSTTATDGSAFASNAGDDAHLIAKPFTVTMAAPDLTTGDTKTYGEADFSPPISYANQDGTPGKNIYISIINDSGGADTADDSNAIKIIPTGPQN